MVTITRGVLKGYTAGTHRASVQVAGSLSVWLTSIPVATDIPAAEVQAGRECAVLFFTEDNPADAVVVTVHGAAPAAATPPTRIVDADLDTSVNVEETADSDIIVGYTAGTTRFILANSAIHNNFNGDFAIAGRLRAGQDDFGFVGGVHTAYGHSVGENAGTVPNILTCGLSHEIGFSKNGINCAPSWQATANNLTFKAITGNALVGLPSTAAANLTGLSAYGLYFVCTWYNLSSTKTLAFLACAAMFVQPSIVNIGLGLTVGDLTGVHMQPQGNFSQANLTIANFRSLWANFPGGTSITNYVGLEIDAVTGGTNRYGVRAGDIAGGTIARILELGPATPHLRLEGTGNYAPGINTATSPLLVLFGNNDNPLTKTLRRIQWKDGATIGAGDRVLVAV